MCYPVYGNTPGFDINLWLTTSQQWFRVIRLSDLYLPSYHWRFTSMLTTLTLNDSRLKWFEACFRKPTLKDLPSSFLELKHKLHWIMEVNFGKDATLASQGNAAENLAILKRLPGTLIRIDLGGVLGRLKEGGKLLGMILGL